MPVIAKTLTRGAESSGKGGYADRRQEDDDNIIATPTLAFQERGREGGRSLEYQEDVAYSLNAPSGGGRRQELNIASGWAVRRLMPIECERLQGFPDQFTAVPHRGKPAADGPRYKALGNSMAVNVMRWIGQRIEMVEQIDKEAA
ncbi:Modification methylase HhaI [compost metagenome]